MVHVLGPFQLEEEWRGREGRMEERREREWKMEGKSKKKQRSE